MHRHGRRVGGGPAGDGRVLQGAGRRGPHGARAPDGGWQPTGRGCRRFAAGCSPRPGRSRAMAGTPRRPPVDRSPWGSHPTPPHHRLCATACTRPSGASWRCRTSSTPPSSSACCSRWGRGGEAPAARARPAPAPAQPRPPPAAAPPFLAPACSTGSPAAAPVPAAPASNPAAAGPAARLAGLPAAARGVRARDPGQALPRPLLPHLRHRGARGAWVCMLGWRHACVLALPVLPRLRRQGAEGLHVRVCMLGGRAGARGAPPAAVRTLAQPCTPRAGGPLRPRTPLALAPPPCAPPGGLIHLARSHLTPVPSDHHLRFPPSLPS